MNFTHTENRIASYSESKELLAEITFPYLDESTVNINHTYVNPSLRGQGIAEKLMLELTKVLVSRNLKAVPTCSYAQTWFNNHPDYNYLLK